MKTLVFNGWAVGSEVWNRCTFRYERLIDYIEQLDGVPEREMDDSDDVLLVGFSMGGSTALRLALAEREKVRGLVLISATARMMEDLSSGWRGLSPRRRAALRLGTVMSYRGNQSPLYDERNLDRGLDYLDRIDLRGELTLAGDFLKNVPVAIFQSERDGIVRPENAHFLKRVFPHAELHLISGGEHTLPVSVPERISEVISRFQNFS